MASQATSGTEGHVIRLAALHGKRTQVAMSLRSPLLNNRCLCRVDARFPLRGVSLNDGSVINFIPIVARPHWQPDIKETSLSNAPGSKAERENIWRCAIPVSSAT